MLLEEQVAGLFLSPLVVISQEKEFDPTLKLYFKYYKLYILLTNIYYNDSKLHR